MSDPILSKPAADLGDAVVDRVLDLIDQEPDQELRLKLLRKAYAREWQLERRPPDPSIELDGGAYIIRFGSLREYVVPLLRIAPRRLDA